MSSPNDESSAESEFFQSAQRLSQYDELEELDLEGEFHPSQLADSVRSDDENGDLPSHFQPNVDALHGPYQDLGNGDPQETARQQKELGAIPKRAFAAFGQKIAKNVDRDTASDLSIHLYSAFRYKVSESTRKSRSRSLSRRNSSSRGRSSRATRSWTAWPLPINHPALNIQDGSWEEDTLQVAPRLWKPLKPRCALQDLLLGQILKSGHSRLKNDFERSENSSVQPTARSTDDTDGNPTHRTTRIPQQGAGIITDDDEAWELLRPSVQGILTRLDDLLLRLHFARGSTLSSDGPKSRSTSRKRGRPASQGSQAKSSREQDKSPNVSADEHLASLSQDNADSKPQEILAKQRRRASSTFSPHERFLRRKLGLDVRDWRDVLGIAVMCGIDAGVVERTRSRCASLFGSNVKFETEKDFRGKKLKRSVLTGKRL